MNRDRYTIQIIAMACLGWLTSSYPTVGTGQKARPQDWIIHLILFAQADPSIDTITLLPNKQPTTPQTDAAISPKEYPSAWQRLTPESSWSARCDQLIEAGYKHCKAFAWHQPAHSPYKAFPLAQPCQHIPTPERSATLGSETTDTSTIPQEGQAESLPTHCEATPDEIFQGTVKIAAHDNGLPYVTLSIQTTDARDNQTQISWHISQTLRVNQVAYLDHDVLGGLIQITAYTPTTTQSIAKRDASDNNTTTTEQSLLQHD